MATLTVAVASCAALPAWRSNRVAELRCDVAVVGAGPAGLHAAMEAGRRGREVLLVDLQRHPGGQIWRAHRGVLGANAEAAWSKCDAAGVRWLGGTTLVDANAGTLLGTTPAGATRRIRARHVVLATGARERMLPFPGWTLPGVVSAGGLQALVHEGLDLEGKRVLVAGTGPLLLATARTVRAHGGQLLGPLERTPLRRAIRMVPALLAAPEKLLQLARLGARVLPRFGARVVQARAAGRALRVTVRTGRGERELECDMLAVGDGLVPQTRLASLLGCATAGHGVRVDPLQRTSIADITCAGEPTGIGGEHVARIEGRIAGAVSAGDLAGTRRLQSRARRARRFADALERSFGTDLADLPPEDTIVCRCEWVSLSQLRPHPDARAAKLQTRCGMGPCQGRACSPVLEQLLGWSTPRSARPPLFPTPVGALAELWSESKP